MTPSTSAVNFKVSNITQLEVNTADATRYWLEFDNSEAGISTSIYLHGYTNKDNKPPVFTQGYKIGAKVNDQLTVSSMMETIPQEFVNGIVKFFSKIGKRNILQPNRISWCGN